MGLRDRMVREAGGLSRGGIGAAVEAEGQQVSDELERPGFDVVRVKAGGNGKVEDEKRSVPVFRHWRELGHVVTIAPGQDHPEGHLRFVTIIPL